MMKFQQLFQPITINGMTLKNRLVMPALHFQYTTGGYATDRFNKFYWRRADGGVGLIIVGGCALDNHVGYADMMSLADDKFIPGYKAFTDGIHARDTKVAVEFMQTGRYGRTKYITGDDAAIAPSAVYAHYTRETPRSMTIEEIKTIIHKWAAAAVRAKQAGFDAIEITGASGYLISQFLSPLTNLREDEYGGSWENRCRFPLELVAALRVAVGPDYPLIMRVAGNDFMKGGNTNEDCVAFCKLLDTAGINMIDVTGGWHETTVPQLPGDVPRGGFAYLAQAVKDAVSIPVMACNRFNDPIVAETAIALGKADLIGVGRPLIADPDLPKKAQAGELELIRRCVACNQGCLAKMFFDQPIECLVNSIAGREYMLEEKKPVSAKNLLVIGGGPGGCEFAIRAAERGHKVTLWERESAIGGQLNIVAVPPSKHEFSNLIRYFNAMLKKHRVDVVLNKEATAEDIKNSGFDAVILATGATTNRIALPCSKIPVYTAMEILEQNVIAGRNVVMVGGGAVGCETADYLAHEGSISEEQLYFMMSQQSESMEKITDMLNSSRRNISIVDIAKIGAGFDPGCGWPVLNDMKRLGIKQYPLSKILDVTDDKVIIEVTDKKTSDLKRVEIPCDTIVIAVGFKSDNALYEALKDCGLPVYNIGDSAKVGKVIHAIRQADDLAINF